MHHRSGYLCLAKIANANLRRKPRNVICVDLRKLF